jgi:hypothetical protein
MSKSVYIIYHPDDINAMLRASNLLTAAGIKVYADNPTSITMADRVVAIRSSRGGKSDSMEQALKTARAQKKPVLTLDTGANNDGLDGNVRQLIVTLAEEDSQSTPIVQAPPVDSQRAAIVVTVGVVAVGVAVLGAVLFAVAGSQLDETSSLSVEPVIAVEEASSSTGWSLHETEYLSVEIPNNWAATRSSSLHIAGYPGITEDADLGFYDFQTNTGVSISIEPAINNDSLETLQANYRETYTESGATVEKTEIIELETGTTLYFRVLNPNLGFEDTLQYIYINRRNNNLYTVTINVDPPFADRMQPTIDRIINSYRIRDL